MPTTTRVWAAMLAAWGLLVAWPPPASGNDGSAEEIATGGIQLRSERRVAMRKEGLHISLDKVSVEYEFVNESAEDVVTAVAFPVPEYRFYPGADRRWGQRAAFTDFKAWVDDRPLSVKTDVRAFVGERDVTKVAESLGLDIVTLGRFWQSASRLQPGGTSGHEESLYQVPKLPPDARKRLLEEGLISEWEYDGEPVPVWSVRITYHWVQQFPPGKTVRIRHEYRPVPGIDVYLSQPKDACIDPPLRRALDSLSKAGGRYAGQVRWVNYTLTTANTWKTPIHDFELLMEYPEGDFVSLCWDGKIEKAGPRTFRSRMKDFVPTSELKVFFFEPQRK